MLKDRIPLDYEFLRADDALYTQRVWREIDIREKITFHSVTRHKMIMAISAS
jgi:hypothetical protein